MSDLVFYCWLLPMLISWVIVFYEYKFTDLPYTKSTAIATGMAGAIPAIGLVIVCWWAGERIEYIYQHLKEK